MLLSCQIYFSDGRFTVVQDSKKLPTSCNLNYSGPRSTDDDDDDDDDDDGLHCQQCRPATDKITKANELSLVMLVLEIWIQAPSDGRGNGEHNGYDWWRYMKYL